MSDIGDSIWKDPQCLFRGELLMATPGPLDVDEFGFPYQMTDEQREMTVIEKITREQALIGVQMCQEWCDAAKAIAPCDRAKFESAIARVYQELELPAPQVKWLPSPLKGIVLAATQIAQRRSTITGKVLVDPLKVAMANYQSRVNLKVAQILQKQIEEPVHASSDATKAVGQELLTRASVITDTNEAVGSTLTKLVHRACLNEFGDFAVLDFVDRVLGRGTTPHAASLITAARHVGWWWPFETAVLATELPIKIERDELGRVHCETGPAISYADGFEVYCLKGLCVPKEAVVDPRSISWDTINATASKELQTSVVGAKVTSWAKGKPAENNESVEEREEAAEAARRLSGLSAVRDLTENVE